MPHTRVVQSGIIVVNDNYPDSIRHFDRTKAVSQSASASSTDAGYFTAKLSEVVQAEASEQFLTQHIDGNHLRGRGMFVRSAG